MVAEMGALANFSFALTVKSKRSIYYDFDEVTEQGRDMMETEITNPGQLRIL
jgi:hypothetical protein